MKYTMIHVLSVWLLLLGIRVNAEGSVPRACVNNLRIIEAAKDQVAIENNLRRGAAIDVKVLTDYIKGGIESLRCPDGGAYTIDAVDEESFCSVHGTMHGVMKKGKGLLMMDLFGREPASSLEKEIDEILVKMSLQQEKMDPTWFEKWGADEMRILADRFFPQTLDVEGEDLSHNEVVKLIRVLSSGNYEEREEAEKRLTHGAKSFGSELVTARNSTDPEMKKRAKSILEKWDAENQKFTRLDFNQYIDALTVLLSETDNSVQVEVLQKRAKTARAIGALNDGQKKLIDACLASGSN